MTKKPAGKTGLYFDVPDGVAKEFREFVERFGMGSLADHAVMALRRHMAHPPTIQRPELPPTAAPSEWKPPPERRRKKGR